MLNAKSCTKFSAGLLLLSTIAIAPKAHAQSVNVPFTGTATNTCAFTTPTAGALVKSGALAAMEGSTGVTGLGVGTAGKVSVSCTNGGTLSAAVPVKVAAPATFLPTVLQSIVQRGTATTAADFTSANTGGPFDAGAWTKATAPLVVPVGTATPLSVAMIVGKNAAGPVPSGTYTYNVQLTVVSN